MTPAEQRNRSASYGTFLKKEPIQREITHEATVLKPEHQGPGQNHVPIMVIVGTEYGFAEEVAEKLRETLQSKLPHIW